MYDNQFYEYTSMLLIKAGHMITPNPIYTNHTSSETLYIDSNKDVVIQNIDRALLSTINNVSLLLEVEWKGIVEELTENVQVYSITVDFSESSRSQNIADIHHLLQQYWSCNHSIIFFKNKNQFVISFADTARSHILSDWFDISEDCDSVIERLSIANMSLDTCDGYFEDFVYALAREYYHHPISFEEASYGMMPIDLLFPKFASFANYVPDDEVTKEDIKDFIRENLSYYETLYGYDYVAIRYEGMDETTSYHNLTDEIERISFEIDFEEEYGEETIEMYNFDDEDDYIEEDDDFLDDLDEDLDSAIFDDPVLMVKWLEDRQKSLDEQSDGENDKGTPKRKKSKMSEPKRKAFEQRDYSPMISDDATPLPSKDGLRDEATHKRLEAENKRREAEQLNEEYGRLLQRGKENPIASQTAEGDTEDIWKTVEPLKAEAQAKRLVADNLRADANNKRQEAERLNEEYGRLTREVAEQSVQSQSTVNDSESVRKEVESLKAAAQAKRLTSDNLRVEATKKRQEAERLIEEYKKLISEEADRIERGRIEAERREQERLELVRKEREIRDQERLEAEHKEREWLENDIRQQERLEAERKERERLEAERREQERLEAERKERERIEAERREQERLEAERKERERIEAERREQEERRQRELDELSRAHSAELSAIKQKYESDLAAVSSEITTIKRRLSEIEDRIPKLNFLQFGEKKNLKSEQEKLTERLAKLNSLIQEMKKHLERETNLENQRYDEILREIESRYE